jgi:hypothetical protein
MIDGGGATDPNYNITVGHLTVDNGGGGDGYCRAIDAVNAAAGTGTWTIQDIASTHNQDNSVINCAATGGTIVPGTVYSTKTHVTNDGGGAADADCAIAGLIRTPSIGYQDRVKLDFNLLPKVPALTAGTAPSGSPVGVRAFRFNQTVLTNTWKGATFDNPFPADISNVSNLDTDLDGVMDLHDNCPTVWNPTQLDTDGNGRGDGC